MKAVPFNGNPRKSGGTAAMLACVGRTLEERGWEAETVHLGSAKILGCRGCQAWRLHRSPPRGMSPLAERQGAAPEISGAAPCPVQRERQI